MLAVPSGAGVIVNMAPFAEAMALKNALFKELSQTDIRLDIKSLSLKKDVDVGLLIKMALTADSSPPVQAALWKCLERCTYDDQKITMATFDAPEARQDYYDIALECMTVNLRDFFKPLVSKFFGLLSKLPSEAQPLK